MPNFDLRRAAQQEFKRLGIGNFSPVQFIDRPLGEIQDFYAFDPNRPAPQFTNEQLGARFQQARTALQTFGDIDGRAQQFNTSLQTVNARLQEAGRQTLNINPIGSQEFGSLEALFPNLSEAGTGQLSIPQERLGILRDIGAAQAAYQAEINRQSPPTGGQPQQSQQQGNNQPSAPNVQQIEEAKQAMMRGELSVEQFLIFRARGAQPAAPGIQDVRAKADQPTPRGLAQQGEIRLSPTRPSVGPKADQIRGLLPPAGSGILAQQMLDGTVQPNRSAMEAAGLTSADYREALGRWRNRDKTQEAATGEVTEDVEEWTVDKAFQYAQGKTNLQADQTWQTIPTEIRQQAFDIIRGINKSKGLDPETGQTVTQEYSVISGDNLTRIARQYGVTVADILRINPQIKNPNLIYPGQKIQIPGDAIASQITPEIPAVNQVDAINNLGNSISDAMTEGKDQADPFTSESVFEEKFNELIDNIFSDVKGYDMGTPDGLVASDGQTVKVDNSSAMAQYESLANTPRIQGYQDDLLTVQTQLAELAAAELAMVNDIRKEVQGEASESFIQALASKRMQDIYPKKLLLQQKEAILQNTLKSEKENIANIMQYWLHDDETKYNRMWDQLNFLVGRMDNEQQLQQMALSNDISILNVIKDIPEGRSVTIGGVTYQGMASTTDLSVIQVQRPNGEIMLIGVDKNTGQVLYETSAGQGRLPAAGGGGGDSFSKQLKEFKAKSELELITDPQNQKINLALNSGKVGYDKEFGVYYDRESFLKANEGILGNPFNNRPIDHKLELEEVVEIGNELVTQ